MREMEIVPHPQIEGIHVFFNTVDYRTPHMHHEFELVWVVEETLRIRSDASARTLGPG